MGEPDAVHDFAFDVGPKVKRAGGRADRGGCLPRDELFPTPDRPPIAMSCGGRGQSTLAAKAA